MDTLFVFGFRLTISSQKCTALKSPKVLFTRTAVRDNFFQVPSLNCINDLTSELCGSDIDSDVDTPDLLVQDEPRFELGSHDDKSTQQLQSKDKHKPLSICNKLLPLAGNVKTDQSDGVSTLPQSSKVDSVLNRKHATSDHEHSTGHIITNDEPSDSGRTNRQTLASNVTVNRDTTDNVTSRSTERKSRINQTQEIAYSSDYKTSEQISNNSLTNKKVRLSFYKPNLVFSPFINSFPQEFTSSDHIRSCPLFSGLPLHTQYSISYYMWADKS